MAAAVRDGMWMRKAAGSVCVCVCVYVCVCVAGQGEESTGDGAGAEHARRELRTAMIAGVLRQVAAPSWTMGWTQSCCLAAGQLTSLAPLTTQRRLTATHKRKAGRQPAEWSGDQ